MTDQELIALLEQKTPDELTLDEIELLRVRLADSPELRDTLIGQLQMETYLAAALGRVNLSPEKIVAKAQQQTQASSTSILLVLTVLLCLPLVVLGGAVLMNALRPSSDENAIAQAGRGKSKSADKNTADNPANGNQGENQPGTGEAAPGSSENAGGDPSKPQSKGNQNPTPNPGGATPPAPVLPPWHAALEAGGETPPFAQVAFQRFDTAKTMPQKEDLLQWFESAPGYNFQVRGINSKTGPGGVLDGLARLKSPWPENTVLRLDLDSYNRLKLHFFHGLSGVTLIYYEDQAYRWGAFATTRVADKAMPKTWALTATDDDRGRRSELRQGGPIELRYHEGEIILSRGDIVLLSAPLAGPPTDVYFEGKAAFQGIALVRAKGVPVALPRPGPVVQEIERPADLSWKSSRPKIAEPEKLESGALRLAGDNLKERVHCFAPLPRQGLNEVILQLEGVTPGTSVLLTYQEGQAHQVLRFYRDRLSNQTYVRVTGWNDECESEFEQPVDKTAAVVQADCWVKLLTGCGTLRWCLSSDGIHWGEPDYMLYSCPPQPTGLGLEVVANRPGASITLKRIILRELAGLTALAPPDVREKAVALPQAASTGAWLAEVLAAKPAEIATPEWLRACTIQTLGAGPKPELAYPLLEALLDDMTARQLPLAEQLAALSDAALLCWDFRDGQAMRDGVPRRFANLGMQSAQRQSLPAWSSVRQAAMSAPIHSHLAGPVEPDRNIRWELIQRVNTRQPAETLEFCRQLRLFDQQRYSPLVEWAESLALRDLPGKAAGESIAKLKDSWRDPLIEELSKETYNVTTELQAVLESEAWDDAARLITAVDAESAPGVAPYIQDRVLLASLPVAVRLTLEDYPLLRQSLGERFGPLAGLRIGQAMASGDAATVEMATVQFAGTDAAAEAHRWLGDRALASGWFERAIAEYRRALRIAPSLAVQVAPRIRLAAAMQGRDEGEPVTATVRFNELDMSASEFESLVKEMRGRGDTTTLSVAASQKSMPPVPAARSYETEVRARLDGPAGDRPQEEVGRRTNQFKVPWSDRQIATVVEGDTLYVANRFQVAAYSLSTGQRKWQSQPPPGTMAKAQDWALIAMKPLVTGRHIFARMLYSSNPLLVCLEKSSGKVVWVAEGRTKEYLVSDPIIVQGQLGAVGISLQDDQIGLLRWNTFDAETGELQSQRDLIRLRNTWGARACCELAPLEDSIVAVLGGLTMAFDPTGQVRWIRKHVSLPAEEDARWVLQLYQRPLIDGERMFVVQPGVRSVDCLNVTTGRIHWSTPLPEIVGLIGLSGERLIVRTESEVLALDRQTGQSVWQFASPEMHSFCLADERQVLIPSRQRSLEKKDQWLTRLTWLDAATGQPTATAALPKLVDADPRLGPLVGYKDRVFTFFGRGQHDPQRDLVELIPAGEADKPMPAGLPLDPWRQRLAASLLPGAWQVLPEWQLLSGQDGDRTGLVAEFEGEKNVLGIRFQGATPIALGREIAVPAEGKSRLKIRLATDSGQQWRVEVRFAGKLLKTEEIKDEKKRWKTIEVDLSPAAGVNGWLVIQAVSTNGDHGLWWKSAEVLF